MRIIIDFKLSNWNETINANRRNKYIGASLKKKEMSIIKMFLMGKPKITKYPIKLNCKWYTKNLGSDLDNKSLKSVLDAMQEVGILENDNCKHIDFISHSVVKDVKDFLIIEIIEPD